MRYEKISLILMYVGLTMASILCLFRLIYWAAAFYSLIGVSLLIIHFFRIRKKEKIRLLEKRKENANNRMKKVIKLLKEFNIKNDDKELDNLINNAEKGLAKIEKQRVFSKSFGDLLKYIYIPMATIIISEIVKGEPIQEILKRTIIIAIVFAFIVIVAVSIGSSFGDLIYREKERLNLFIDDINDIKTFKEMSVELGYVNKSVVKKE